MKRRIFIAAATLASVSWLLALPPAAAQGRTARSGFDLVRGQPSRTTAGPDGPCFDNHVRFVNCGNGTVTDTATGVIWTFDAGCLPATNWKAANEAAATVGDGVCGLTDGSSPGDWRLATAEEWDEIVDASCPFGTPLVVGNQTGGGCFGAAPWATGLVNAFYWTSTSSKGAPSFGADFAYVADLFFGGLSVDPKVRPLGYGWAVRSASR